MSLRDLNPPQRKAVKTLRGPLLVLAGAGSGKTRVITFRIAQLIQTGVAPQRILAMTFTNKAAREMKERSRKLLGGGKRRPRGQAAPEICTFHSLCVKILRRHIDRLGYPRTFPIYDRGDQDAVARTALRDIRVSTDRLRPNDLLACIGGWKSQGVVPAKALELAQSDREHIAASAYARYQESLKAAGALDFDDLLLCTEQLFDEHPEVRYAESTRYDYVLIDEYQDTNGSQYRVMKALAERHRNICVVGDDDQSIYGWRGAEVHHILNFANDWKGATVVRLEDNYRSREPILALANTLIAHNSARHGKVLRAARGGGPPPRFVRFEDELAEAASVAREIAGLIASEREDRLSPSDIAILFRTNEQPRPFEAELRRNRVPYTLVGGMSFFDRKEIRDLLSYLKLLAHPDDEVALLRAINTPPRGIGSASIQALLRQAVAEGQPLWRVLPHAGSVADVPSAVVQRIERFRTLIGSLTQEAQVRPIADVVRTLLQRIDYRKELERSYRNPADLDARWNSVEELVNSVAQYESRTRSPSVAGFLEETALSGNEDQRDEKEQKQERAVTLMTLHAAKGLEFPHVYMVGMEEGLLPHRRCLLDPGGIPEERRLCYVGVTRAQDVLTMSLAKSRMKWGKATPSIASRFLLEMRGETEKAQRAAVAAEERYRRDAPAEPGQDKPKKKARSNGATKKTRAAKKARATKKTRAATPSAKADPAAAPPTAAAPTAAQDKPTTAKGAPAQATAPRARRTKPAKAASKASRA